MLIAEDDFLIAKHLTAVIETAGGRPLGPVAECADAQILAHTMSVDLVLQRLPGKKARSA